LVGGGECPVDAAGYGPFGVVPEEVFIVVGEVSTGTEQEFFDVGVADAVEATVAGGEEPVDVVAGFKGFARFVDAPVPGYAGAL
jgi:hypothetical protein